MTNDTDCEEFTLANPHDVEYQDANTSYCYTCEKTIPNAHVRFHLRGDL